MYFDLIPVFVALAAGWLWRRHTPGGVDAAHMAQALNMLMIYVTGPALLAAVLPSPKKMRANAPGPYTQRRARWIEGQMRQLGQGHLADL